MVGEVLQEQASARPSCSTGCGPIPAKRLLLLFNACHSGEISPALGVGAEAPAFGGVNLPTTDADALLSSTLNGLQTLPGLLLVLHSPLL